MGRGVPPEETVCAGREGQLTGPGMAHQATAAHCQCQHPRQPQVSKAGVYELRRKRAAALLVLNLVSQCKKILNQAAVVHTTALLFPSKVRHLACGSSILELSEDVLVLNHVALNAIRVTQYYFVMYSI